MHVSIESHLCLLDVPSLLRRYVDEINSPIEGHNAESSVLGIEPDRLHFFANLDF